MVKIAANRVRGFAARPDPRVAGMLLYGPDAAEVDSLRVRLIGALSREADTEVTRLDPQEARRDPAMLADSLRSTGLFGGRPLVLIEGAADALAPAAATALENPDPQAGRIVITAGALPARSKLRKLFETGPSLAALAVYPQALDRAGIIALLQEEGLATAGDEAVDALAAFAETADAAEVRAVARSLALYALDAPAPVTAAELQALLPATIDGEVDTVVAAVAERRAAAALSAFARVAAQGAGASSVASALGRHFRQIHAVASAPDGPEAAIGRLRPPVYGPRRDALSRAVRAWPPRLSETALEMILETEFTLRSTGGPPDRAVVERLLVRLSTLRPR